MMIKDTKNNKIRGTLRCIILLYILYKKKTCEHTSLHTSLSTQAQAAGKETILLYNNAKCSKQLC